MREDNEDSLVAGPWTLCAVTTLMPQTLILPIDDPVVVAVADGLGGHPAGEHASSLAVRWLARAASGLTTEDALRESLTACNEAVHTDADRNPERTAMGTTVAGLVITGDTVTAFNVGDSRVYAVVGTGIEQLSLDDNEAPAAGRRRSTVVTQALGGSAGADPVWPHITSRPLVDGARYLVCSDGLTDAVDDAMISAVLGEHESGRAAFELWKATIEAGAPDNVTIALVDLVSQPDG